MLASNRTSLTTRFARAGAWSLFGFGLGQAIRLGTNLILTRLLLPEAFGTMAIAIVVMVGLAMFSDLGVKQSIIQHSDGSDPAFLNTAWVVQILRGFLLWPIAVLLGLALLLAQRAGVFPVDSVYMDPSLPYVIIVLSLSAVISGFSSTKLYEASRGLTLGRVTLIEVGSQIVSLAIILLWLTMDRTVWALVVGALCGSLVSTILSHAVLPGVSNRWHWNRPAFEHIFKFGKWILLSSFLGFIVNSGDRLLLGWFVDAAVLGVYYIAFSLYFASEQLISKSLVDTSFSALSEVIRSREVDLKRVYYKIYTLVSVYCYVSAGFLLLASPIIINILYDERYQDAGWMLQVLALGLLGIPTRLVVNCMLARGRPKFLAYTIALRIAVLLGGVPLLFEIWGVYGAVMAVTLSYISGVPLLIIYASRNGIFDWRREILLLGGLPAGAVLGVLLTTIASA